MNHYQFSRYARTVSSSARMSCNPVKHQIRSFHDLVFQASLCHAKNARAFSREQAQSICFKIQCDQYLQTAAKDATAERAAGLLSMASTLTGQGITVSNIVDYMSLIEQRSMQARVPNKRFNTNNPPCRHPQPFSIVRVGSSCQRR